MYHVALADDELLDLEGMERFVPWSDLGMEVVYTATNSFKVLEFIRNHPIDVLVTDIRMPIMSGLELAAALKEESASTKVVFVSGYEDFQYARKAIQMNASGYVLKPVSDEEMIRVLKEVRQQLDEEHKQIWMESRYKESEQWMKQELLQRWLKGEETEENQIPYPPTSWEHIDYPVRGILVEADNQLMPEPLNVQKVLKERSRWQQRFMMEAEKSGYMLAVRTDRNRIFLAADVDKGLTLRPPESLLFWLRSQEGMTATIALSREAYSWEALPSIYQETEQLMEQKLFLGKNRIIKPEDATAIHARDTRNLEQVLNRLFAAMVQYDLVCVDDQLQELFQMARGFERKLTVHNFVQHLLSRLDAFLASMNENLTSMLGLGMDQLDILYHFETLDDIQSWMRRRTFEISELLHMKRLRKNRKIIGEVQTYVRENLDQTIVLREIAERFAFSPNYLGQLFKEEVGIHFSDFVTKERMNRARELMHDSKLKIYEVASAVGYKNIMHFNRLFKEHFGLTPSEMRRQL
ncbi:two-component system response regulator YesN [Paenibacillus rhizosphaerae]|uniref:Two-component system response regulator YesN n=1 Tax=Paenibacillus rhizosphaerae TaxID=297318 RepID=A0A839TTU6_9BACL|nr:response regulator [Paenibacillus rhizosphaerae]MBB3128838.1 two-component system response regulator YesN [Paenibacillus rhizosphaerae]